MARLAVRMPKMSMTMTEGEVGTWQVAVGDTVAEGDVIAEVMTDKVDMEVESTVAGVLVEIVAESGVMVPVGEPMGWVEGEDGGGGFGDLLTEPEPQSEPGPTGPTPAPRPASEPEAGPIAAVPRARGLAAERGVDLARLSGTGPDGLVTVADVEAELQPTAPAPEGSVPADGVVADLDETAVEGTTTSPFGPNQQAGTASPTPPDPRGTAVRRAVARVMVPSAAIPQFTVWRTLHLDAADVGRRGLSWTTVMLRTYAGALREVPELLSRWEEDGPTEPAAPCVAVAVATDRGLLVPTFAEPDTGAADAVDAELRRVVSRARTGKVDPTHMGVANASLSNLGGLGVDRFSALLTPPQASVLALGSVSRRPVAVPGGVGTALTLEAGLTVDHRVADGVHAARLLAAVQARLGGAL